MCYEQIIKMLEAEKEEYKKSIREPGLRLKGEEERLFRLLKEGPAKSVKPAMIHEVTERLAGDSTGDL